MNLLIGVPGDVLLYILSEWLQCREYGLLDVSCCNNKIRKYLLDHLRLIIVQETGKPCFYDWVYRRHMTLKCLTLIDSSFDTDNLSFSLKNDQIETIIIQYDDAAHGNIVVQVINSCASLRSLEWRSYDFDPMNLINFRFLVSLLVEFDFNYIEELLTIISSQCNVLVNLNLLGIDKGKHLQLYEQIFKQNPNLNKLESWSCLTCSFIEKHCPKIEILILRNNKLDPLEIIPLINNSSIKFVSLYTNVLDIIYVKGTNYLEIFGFHSMFNTKYFQAAIFNGIKNIQSLNIQGCEEDFVDNYYKTLKELSVEMMSESLLRKVLQKCSILEKLTLCDIKRDHEAIVRVFAECMPRLTELNIESVIPLKDINIIIASCSQLRICKFANVEHPKLIDLNEFKRLCAEKSLNNDIECTISYRTADKRHVFKFFNGIACNNH